MNNSSNFNIYSKFNQNNDILDDIIKISKTKSKNKTEQEEYFKILLDEKISDQKKLLQMIKKSKKNVDNNSLLLIPMYFPMKITHNNLVKLKNKNNKCGRCGNIINSEKSYKVVNNSDNVSFCDNCMRNDFSDFLNMETIF